MKSGETKLFLGILLAAVLLGAAAIYPALTSSRNERKPRELITDPIKARVSRKDLFPEGSWYQGDPKAPFLLVEFADYQCPVCATVAPQLDEILKKHPGKFCYVFHGIQIQKEHANALIMAQAAEAAGFQGKFWEMHHKLMKDQANYKTLDFNGAVDAVMAAAKQLRLDLLKFGSDLRSTKAVDGQARSAKIALNADVILTPTFFVVPQKGPTIKMVSFKEFEKWVEETKELREP